MKKCPRCKLPQEGMHKCQYCGYVLAKHKKMHTGGIRKKLKYIIGGLNKDQLFRTKKLKLLDNGGTRSGTDRRKFLCITYFPEKRLGMDRRKGFDRRSQVARKIRSERRFSLNHRKPHPRKKQGHFQTATLK